MLSTLAFFMIFLQTVVIAGSYLAENVDIFYALVVHGSPLMMVQRLLTSESIFATFNALYVGLAGFHLAKYVIVARARFIDDRNMRLTLAIILEVSYLLFSAYYMQILR